MYEYLLAPLPQPSSDMIQRKWGLEDRRAPVPVAWLISRPHEQADEEEERDHVCLRRAGRINAHEQDADGRTRARLKQRSVCASTGRAALAT